MAIDYTVDIVRALFATDVVSDAAYQIPGTYGLPTDFGVVSLSGGAIAAAGTGYALNNILTLSGGTHTTAAQVKVTGVSTGAVTAYTVQTVGAYTAIPSNPVGVSGGAGSGFQLTATWNGFAQQRLLTFVEIMRSYLNEIDNTHEAKLLQEVMARMMASMRFGVGVGGAGWNGTTMSANAQTDGLRFIAKHVLATDL